jgi:membrane protease YdiL (CAAX protease family)
LIASILDKLIGGSGSTLEKAALTIINTPLSIIPFILYIFLGGPFVEELGWRGYVLDRLQEKRNALISSLILGFLWALWHVPLFYIKGTYQYAVGAGTPSFWLFMISTVSGTILFTWIFNNTNRSTLAAILFHFMGNFTGELIAASKNAEIFLTMLWVLPSVIITIL